MNNAPPKLPPDPPLLKLLPNELPLCPIPNPELPNPELNPPRLLEWPPEITPPPPPPPGREYEYPDGGSGLAAANAKQDKTMNARIIQRLFFE